MTSQESGLNFSSDERLVLAILRQAIMDFNRSPIGSIKWFNDTPNSTYRLCTTVLDVDPHDFRKRIAQYIGLPLNRDGYMREDKKHLINSDAVSDLAFCVFNFEHAPQIPTHDNEMDEII